MIILTGGAGFIGSCFLWRLNEAGISDVLVVDHLDDTEKWKNLRGKKFKDYVQKDDFLHLINDGNPGKIDRIVHMGACSSTTLTDAGYFIKNNYEYSKILARWAQKKEIPFIYASSAATYGDGTYGYKDDPGTTYKLKPLNMYGYSKQLFDLWVLNNGLDDKVTGIKFFNVFGPNEYHKGEMMSVICKKYREISENGCISLFKSYNKEYKDGGQKRDFIYVKDAVDVMYELFNNPDKTGIFNLGTGTARSWEDLAHAMFAAVGEKPCIKYIEMPEYLRPKYQYFTQADLSRLKQALPNISFRTLEESVKEYITDYLSKEAYL